MVVFAQAKLKRVHQQNRHQKDLGEGLHVMDFDQLNIQNQKLVAELSKCSAKLLQAKRTSASILQACCFQKLCCNFLSDSRSLATTL